MNITCDPRYNIAYIRLREKAGGLRTLQIGEDANVDISSDGKIYGIELLNANEQLMTNEMISFTDESTGRAFALPLMVSNAGPGRD